MTNPDFACIRAGMLRLGGQDGRRLGGHPQVIRENRDKFPIYCKFSKPLALYAQ